MDIHIFRNLINSSHGLSLAIFQCSMLTVDFYFYFFNFYISMSLIKNDKFWLKNTQMG